MVKFVRAALIIQRNARRFLVTKMISDWNRAAWKIQVLKEYFILHSCNA